MGWAARKKIKSAAVILFTLFTAQAYCRRRCDVSTLHDDALLRVVSSAPSIDKLVVSLFSCVGYWMKLKI